MVDFCHIKLQDKDGPIASYLAFFLQDLMELKYKPHIFRGKLVGIALSLRSK